MQLTKILKVTLRNELVTVHLGVGGSIDDGLLSGNHHKMNLIVGEDL
jgi:hypothetical protein